MLCPLQLKPQRVSNCSTVGGAVQECILSESSSVLWLCLGLELCASAFSFACLSLIFSKSSSLAESASSTSVDRVKECLRLKRPFGLLLVAGLVLGGLGLELNLLLTFLLNGEVLVVSSSVRGGGRELGGGGGGVPMFRSSVRLGGSAGATGTGGGGDGGREEEGEGDGEGLVWREEAGEEGGEGGREEMGGGGEGGGEGGRSDTGGGGGGGRGVFTGESVGGASSDATRMES